jgi:hypothetical protein
LLSVLDNKDDVDHMQLIIKNIVSAKHKCNFDHFVTYLYDNYYEFNELYIQNQNDTIKNLLSSEVNQTHL